MKIKKYVVIGIFLLLSSLFVTGGKITVKEGATTNIDQDLSITGNVGIGTANPGAKLDVAGSIRFQSAAMSSPEDLILKSLAAIYTQGLGGAPVYHYWNDAAGQTCTTKCSNMGHTCIAAFAVHQSYVSMPGCGYDGTAGLACLCNP